MKLSELLLYPLLSLALVIFIYFLATKQTAPPTNRVQTIKIYPLETIETSRDENVALKSFTNSANQQQTVLLDIGMYNQKPFNKKLSAFIPSNRIYVVLELQNLQAGKHTLSATWMIKNGKTVSISSHDIVLQHFTPWHRTYFWLELMKNGAFTEMFTGKEYKSDVFGRWEVQIALDGTNIAKQSFEIRDL